MPWNILAYMPAQQLVTQEEQIIYMLEIQPTKEWIDIFYQVNHSWFNQFSAYASISFEYLHPEHGWKGMGFQWGDDSGYPPVKFYNRGKTYTSQFRTWRVPPELINQKFKIKVTAKQVHASNHPEANSWFTTDELVIRENV